MEVMVLTAHHEPAQHHFFLLVSYYFCLQLCSACVSAAALVKKGVNSKELWLIWRNMTNMLVITCCKEYSLADVEKYDEHAGDNVL